MKKLFVLTFIILTTLRVYSQIKPQIRNEDKIRIREAMDISKQYGDKIWKGINNVPFVILLVTDSIEFLINHPYPSDDFKLVESDTILNSKIYYRKAQFDKHFLATFPAVNGVNCIVVGTPENTGKGSTEWIITLLHEHFHQFENAYPDYYESVNKLDLSGGDQTGMWMLNYPFPYDSIKIIQQYKNYTSALSKTLLSINSKNFSSNFKKYKIERNKFKLLLKPAEYRYFSFQVWQEGIARFTEYKFLEQLVNDAYEPSNAVASLPDFIPFDKYKEKLYQSQSNDLIKLDLKESQRICFYAVGFAEGLLLDKLNPYWKTNFLIDKFYIEHYSKKFE